MRCNDCNRFRTPTVETCSIDCLSEDSVTATVEAVCPECGSVMAEWGEDLPIDESVLREARRDHWLRAGTEDDLDLAIEAEHEEAECSEVNANEGLLTKSRSRLRAPRWVPGAVIRATVAVVCACEACTEAKAEPRSVEIERLVAFEDFEPR
jgi:hypothetical protein